VAAYATVSEYREDTGDEDTADSRVTAVLAQQSAKLRAELGAASKRIDADEDARALARLLVTDAARKCLVRPSFDGVGEVDGATTASFTANGFQGSYTLQNPSGTAYFDRSTLRALKRRLGCGQSCGTVLPFYGGR
jgi:hypothetical protein